MVNLTSDDGEEEPVADNTTSVLPSPSSFTQSSELTAKRRYFGGLKKKSSVWQFYSTNEAADVTCCASCDYVSTPSGLIGNAITHWKKNHADTFTEYVKEERCLFWIATVASMGKANRLSGRNLEGKVLSFRNTGFPAWYRSMNAKCSIRCLNFLVFGKPVSFK